MKKITLAVIVVLLLAGLVFAFDTVYNPYTGKLDYVNVISLSNLTNTHSHDASNITNEKWVNETGDTMTGNLTFQTNKYVCFNNCTTSYIVWNGTTLVIKVN
jgi:hypothetical protein